MTDRRSRVAPFVGAGAAGLALAFAVAPQAVAHQAPQASSAPADPGHGGGSAGAKPAPADETTTTTEAPPPNCQGLQPNYGSQKFRVGVQIKSGAVVPDGTTTAGSEVTITETGPCVDNKAHSITSTCDTAAPIEDNAAGRSGKVEAPDDPDINDSVTYCKFPQNLPARSADPRVESLYYDDFYYAEAGSTVTLRQSGVNIPLITDPVSQTVSPGGTFDPDCTVKFNCASTRAPVILNDTAAGPTAVQDCTINVRVGKSALIDVEANDVPKAPITALAVAVDPTAGTAAVEGTKIRYTPDGTSSTDSFEYRITTGNGTDQAKVCLAIAGVAATSSSVPPSSTTPTTAPVTSTTPATVSVSASSTSVPPLANTGTPTSSLGTVGAGLIVIGGIATVAGTRRRRLRGRHA